MTTTAAAVATMTMTTITTQTITATIQYTIVHTSFTLPKNDSNSFTFSFLDPEGGSPNATLVVAHTHKTTPHDSPQCYKPDTSAVLPDATVLVADVTAAVAVTGLPPAGSPPAAEVVTVTAARFANSPVPVLSVMQK